MSSVSAQKHYTMEDIYNLPDGSRAEIKQVILVYDMEQAAAPAIFSFSDTIKVNIYDSLEIDFTKLKF